MQHEKVMAYVVKLHGELHESHPAVEAIVFRFKLDLSWRHYLDGTKCTTWTDHKGLPCTLVSEGEKQYRL
ncbi:hypothetical protein HanRHA438_Chr15g0684321 [Helianthus annuus]|nr:hypothetical protein HanIR_Chr15g0730221 [Helianthus annuus]KAJ0842783.1 hypothetical protein HanRHA438_Chr15g0684321 [Helianthus annuus]